MHELVFLKLGGSLITDKTRPYTPRLDKLADLATEIAQVRQTHPHLQLVLGHGSGSFGHTAAQEYSTREGILTHLQPNSPNSPQETEETKYWQGFAKVWYQATNLNRYVIHALHNAGLPAITFSPLASVWAAEGHVAQWDVSPIQAALKHGLLPVVHGDVILDRTKGGTILSTEELFDHLARILRPQRILLAGLEAGVWADFPARKHKVERVTRASFYEIGQGVGKAAGADVTGGMEAKVRQMLDLVEAVPGLVVQIFSGEPKGHLRRVLTGETLGTLIESDKS